MQVGGTLLFPLSFPRDRFGEQVGLRASSWCGPKGCGETRGRCSCSHLQLTGNTPLENVGTKRVALGRPFAGGLSFSFEPSGTHDDSLALASETSWALALRSFLGRDKHAETKLAPVETTGSA
jgi:hypothetical protein